MGWRLRVASLPWPPAANEPTETTIAPCVSASPPRPGRRRHTFQDTLTIIRDKSAFFRARPPPNKILSRAPFRREPKKFWGFELRKYAFSLRFGPEEVRYSLPAALMSKHIHSHTHTQIHTCHISEYGPRPFPAQIMPLQTGPI